MGDVKKLADGKFKIQLGELVATYSVDDENKVTFYAKDGSVKNFHFEGSSTDRLKRVANLFYAVAKEVRNQSPPEKEIEIKGNKYRLVEAE